MPIVKTSSGRRNEFFTKNQTHELVKLPMKSKSFEEQVGLEAQEGCKKKHYKVQGETCQGISIRKGYQFW